MRTNPSSTTIGTLNRGGGCSTSSNISPVVAYAIPINDNSGVYVERLTPIFKGNNNNVSPTTTNEIATSVKVVNSAMKKAPQEAILQRPSLNIQSGVARVRSNNLTEPARTMPINTGTNPTNDNQFWQYFRTKGQCKYGSSCKFLHVLPPTTDGLKSESVKEPSPTCAVDARPNAKQTTAASTPSIMDVTTSKLQKTVQFLNEQERKALTLDLVIVMDCTLSMKTWIDSAKASVNTCVDQIQSKFGNKTTIRVGFVAYRDYDLPDKRIKSISLTTNIDAVRKFISEEKAESGIRRDRPEDIPGGLQTAIDMKWQASAKIIILIADSPCHGRRYHDLSDDHYPNGHPNSPNIEQQMLTIASKGIGMVMIDVCPIMNKKMISLLQPAYDCGVSLLSRDSAKKKVEVLSNTVVFKVVPFNRASGNFPGSTNDESILFMITLIESATASLEESATKSIESLTKQLQQRGQKQRESTASTLTDLDAKDEAGRDESQSKSSSMPPASLNWSVMEHLHSENAIRYTYWFNIQDVDKDLWSANPFKYLMVTQQRTTVRILRSSFNQGKMRTAHGLQDEHIKQQLVAKVYQKPKDRNRESYQMDAKVQTIARGLAQEFSKHPNALAAIDFISVSYYELIDRPETEPFKYFSAEPFMTGTYIKYNNNAGWVANVLASSSSASLTTLTRHQIELDKIAQAFSHFTWDYTLGRLHCVDLQGIDNILTDPQIHSNIGGGKYGKGDIGHWGQALFFRSHICNEHCKALGLVNRFQTCGTSTTTASTGILKAHVRTNHPTVTLPQNQQHVQLCCELYCGTIFSISRQTYLEELATGRGVYCPQCKISVKTDMKLITCDVCNEKFRYKAYWYLMKGMEAPKRCQKCKK